MNQKNRLNTKIIKNHIIKPKIIMSHPKIQTMSNYNTINNNIYTKQSNQNIIVSFSFN